MIFTNVDSALFHLGFVGAKYIRVPSSKESYEHFDRGGRVLYCIGEGPMRSPGHPSGHQYYLNQMLLRGEQHLYPVFKVYSNCVEYMGNYRILSFTKTMSFEGFMYFRYKLFRESVTSLNYVTNPQMDTTPEDTKPQVTRSEVTRSVVTTPMVNQRQINTIVREVTPKTYWFPSCSS